MIFSLESGDSRKTWRRRGHLSWVLKEEEETIKKTKVYFMKRNRHKQRPRGRRKEALPQVMVRSPKPALGSACFTAVSPVIEDGQIDSSWVCSTSSNRRSMNMCDVEWGWVCSSRRGRAVVRGEHGFPEDRFDPGGYWEPLCSFQSRKEIFTALGTLHFRNSCCSGMDNFSTI